LRAYSFADHSVGGVKIELSEPRLPTDRRLLVRVAIDGRAVEFRYRPGRAETEGNSRREWSVRRPCFRRREGNRRRAAEERSAVASSATQPSLHVSRTDRIAVVVDLSDVAMLMGKAWDDLVRCCSVGRPGRFATIGQRAVLSL
jgi:hypothetical protein